MSMPRRERQRSEIVAALTFGQVERAVALARDHLYEFPTDAAMLYARMEQMVNKHDHASSEELAIFFAELRDRPTT